MNTHIILKAWEFFCGDVALGWYLTFCVEAVFGMQVDEKPKRQRSQRTKSVPAELPSVEDALEEDAPEMKPKKRRGKEPDPNAFGEIALSTLCIHHPWHCSRPCQVMSGPLKQQGVSFSHAC